MLSAIARASKTLHLEVYSFMPSGVGTLFVDALARASGRGVAVRVVLDGWGSAIGGRAIAAELREAGCDVRIHNRLLSLLVGRFDRNHRKILLVDDEVAFLGGLNIGDENVGVGGQPGWADVALEIRGPACARLGRLLRHGPRRDAAGAVRIYLSGLGGGWRLRRRYVKAFSRARQSIYVAHGYFLPGRGVVRALVAASRRGVRVHLLLAGRSDVPFARAATRRLHRRLLASGVDIREWSHSVLHAKVAAVDGSSLLIGSFNLDPFSLANLEALVEVTDARLAVRGEAWVRDHLARSRPVTFVEANSPLRRWLLDPLGLLVARLAVAGGRLIAGRKVGRAAQGSRTAGPGSGVAHATAVGADSLARPEGF
ncbi:MAG TPA: phospholipase D-like domain-containing protein [Polyangiaceae bacterium]|nr:phospholipase D-like domain-containing protein [Polyangiaceae bacterium]